jgi:hypothetical protein
MFESGLNLFIIGYRFGDYHTAKFTIPLQTFTTNLHPSLIFLNCLMLSSVNQSREGCNENLINVLPSTKCSWITSKKD